jgi:hypothetical protein
MSKYKVVAMGLNDFINKPLTFEQWIKQFKKDDTAFGDLARDFIQSSHEHYLLHGEPITVYESLEKHMACSDAYNTYHEAMKQYNQYLEKYS